MRCGCAEHLEKTEVDMLVDLPAHELFAHLFEPNQTHVIDTLNRRRKIERWTLLQDWGYQGRQGDKRALKYVLPISNPLVKFKSLDCFESIAMSRRVDNAYGARARPPARLHVLRAR